MAERRLKVGMIGAGFIGQLAHLQNLAENPACELVALAELRPVLRRQVAARHQIPQTFATHQQLLKEADVEAVVVVTPRPHTGPVALDCLQAGKHVLTEKPMAGDTAQADRLVAAARTAEVQYVVGYMKRYDAGVQEARRLLQALRSSGELGPVLLARAHCFMGDSYCNAYGHVVTSESPVYADPGWPSAPADFSVPQAEQYARYLNCFSHNTNLLRYLFDATPSVEYARLAGPAGGLAVLDFGAFRATLETGSTSARGWDEVTEVFFADGRLVLRTPPPLLRNVPAEVELYRAGDEQQICRPQLPWSWSFRRQAEAFVDDIRTGAESLSPGSDAREDVHLIETMWRRQEEGS